MRSVPSRLSTQALPAEGRPGPSNGNDGDYDDNGDGGDDDDDDGFYGGVDLHGSWSATVDDQAVTVASALGASVTPDKAKDDIFTDGKKIF